MEIDDAD